MEICPTCLRENHELLPVIYFVKIEYTTSSWKHTSSHTSSVEYFSCVFQFNLWTLYIWFRLFLLFGFSLFFAQLLSVAWIWLTFCWAEWLSSCLGSRLQAWLLCPGTSLNPLVSTAFFKYIWCVWVFSKLCKKWHSIFLNRDVSDRVAIMINLLSGREMILELYHRSP